MVSIDDVRARVQAAAERQIQERTDAAAGVADAVQDVTVKRTALGGAQQALDEAMRAALSVMSMEELADFTGLSKSQLTSTAGRKRSGRATTSRRRTASNRPALVSAAESSGTGDTDGSDAA